MKPAYIATENTIAEGVRCRCCGSQPEEGDELFRASGVTACSRECARVLIQAQAIEEQTNALHRLIDVQRRAR